VLGAVISAALLTAALILTASGPKTCAGSMGTACPSLPSRSMSARADADAPRAEMTGAAPPGPRWWWIVACLRPTRFEGARPPVQAEPGCP
jgi:hypothetical protein